MDKIRSLKLPTRTGSICGCEFVESIGAGMAKLLRLLYQKRYEQPMALCKQTTGEMVQMEQADEFVQEPQMAE